MKPAVVFFGTTHAREWVTTMVTEYLVYSLLDQYKDDEKIERALDCFDFYIFPVVNPDGTLSICPAGLRAQAHTSQGSSTHKPNTACGEKTGRYRKAAPVLAVISTAIGMSTGMRKVAPRPRLATAPTGAPGLSTRLKPGHSHQSYRLSRNGKASASSLTGMPSASWSCIVRPPPQVPRRD